MTVCLIVSSATMFIAPAASADTEGSNLITETFAGPTISGTGWKSIGDSCLTRAAPDASDGWACGSRNNAPSQTQDPGFLQLTDARNNRSGGVVYDNPLPGNGGLVVEFEQWQYGGSGADGIGFFLTDGSTTLDATGSLGGGLGYTSGYGTSDVPREGVNGGFVGVGLDAWGNYANPAQKDQKCEADFPSPGRRVPNTVGLRGPGQGMDGYCWLTGSIDNGASTLPASLRGSSSEEEQGRSVRITVSTDALPVVTVEVDFHDGNGYGQIFEYQMTTPAPSTYKLGFLAATGNRNDTHLLRNVRVSSVEPLGELNLVKQIDKREPQPDAYAEGSSIPYTFVVTNTSVARLTDIVVTDPDASNISCPATTLEPTGTAGDAIICTGMHTVTATDAVQSTFVNTAQATANDGGTDLTSNESSATAPIAAVAPALSLEKSAQLDDINANGVADLGEGISYSFLVANTGNVTIKNISIRDDRISGTDPVTLELAPGESGTMLVPAARQVTQDDIDDGRELTNTATAYGKTAGDTTVTSEPSTAVVPVAPSEPALTIEKTAALNDGDGDALASVGETISYSFVVQNTGNVTLSDVTIDDSRVTGLDPQSVARLAPGETVTFSAEEYAVTQADVDAGDAIRNTAIAHGTPPSGDPVASDPDSTETPVVAPEAALSIKKTADQEALFPGEKVTYSFEIKNTGNVTLTAVSVAEGKFTGSGDLSDASCPADELAPGASVVCTAAYTVHVADSGAGSVTNSAAATGTDPAGESVTSDLSEVTVTVLRQVTLPEAGGVGTAGYLFAGSGVLLAVALVWAISLRRSRAEDMDPEFSEDRRLR